MPKHFPIPEGMPVHDFLTSKRADKIFSNLAESYICKNFPKPSDQDIERVVGDLKSSFNFEISSGINADTCMTIEQMNCLIDKLHEFLAAELKQRFPVPEKSSGWFTTTDAILEKDIDEARQRITDHIDSGISAQASLIAMINSFNLQCWNCLNKDCPRRDPSRESSYEAVSERAEKDGNVSYFTA